MPAALHGDPVPRQVRPRAHRGRLQIEVEITRQVIDIDIAAGAAVQRTGIDRQLQALGRPGAAQVQRRGERAQSRQLQQVLQRTAGRLIQLQHGIHAFRIELQVQDIVANPAYAVRIHLDDHIGERAQADCSPQQQRRRHDAELRPQIELVDRHARGVDMRYGRWTGSRRARAFGNALHDDFGRLETIDLHSPREQRERRPAQCYAIGGQPYSAAIAELQLVERQFARQRSAQSS